MSETVLFCTGALEVGLLLGYGQHAVETWIRHGRSMALSFAYAMGGGRG